VDTNKKINLRRTPAGWEKLGTEPYTRKDGKPATLVLWGRRCPECSDWVIVKLSEKMTYHGQFETRRCPECRDPKRVANGTKGFKFARMLVKARENRARKGESS
jgi:hypothetical protein